MASESAIIERAEMYLRKLSCGINPLTDEILPEGDSCKQERISKCLAYVASLLQQQLNHDQLATASGTPASAARKSASKTPKGPKAPKQPLSIAPESIGNYRFFDYPVSISRVVRNINELIPAGVNMNHLLYADVANFLVQQGILSRQMTENGSEANLPTELGGTYGFEKGESDLRGHHNIYTQCGEKAQQFILDNLQKCIDIANERFATHEAANDDEADHNGRKSRQKFHLSAEELGNYPADETPIPVSEIARRLNTLIGPDMERIYYKVIRDWYVSEGYLEFKESANGKGAFLPTEKGSLAGLMVESRTGKLGELFDVVMYDSKAQRLFLEHLAKAAN